MGISSSKDLKKHFTEDELKNPTCSKITRIGMTKDFIDGDLRYKIVHENVTKDNQNFKKEYKTMIDMSIKNLKFEQYQDHLKQYYRKYHVHAEDPRVISSLSMSDKVVLRLLKPETNLHGIKNYTKINYE